MISMRIVGILSLALFIVAGAVLAQPFEPIYDPTSPPPDLPATGQDLTDLIEDVVLWLGVVLGAISVLALFWSGFLFMTAGDDDSRLQKAKAWLKYGIIGVVVALFGAGIVPLVRDLLAGNFF